MGRLIVPVEGSPVDFSHLAQFLHADFVDFLFVKSSINPSLRTVIEFNPALYKYDLVCYYIIGFLYIYI